MSKRSKRRNKQHNKSRRSRLSGAAQSSTGSNNKGANQEAQTKGKIKAQQKGAARTINMEVAASVLAIAFAIVGAIGAMLFSDGHHRDIGLWVIFLAIVLGIMGGFCVYQDRLWDADRRKGAPASQSESGNRELQPDQRAWINVVASEFSGIEAGKIPEYTIQIKNTGKTPAVIIRRATGLFILGRGVEEDEVKNHIPSEDKGAVENVALAPDTAVFMPVPNNIFNVPQDIKADIDSGARKLFVVG